MYYIEFPSTTEVTKQKSIVNFNATFGSQNVSPTWRPGGVTTPNDSPSGTTVGTEAGPSIGGAARCSIRPPPQPPRRPTPPNPLSSNLSRKWCVILRRARRCRKRSASAPVHAFTRRLDTMFEYSPLFVCASFSPITVEGLPQQNSARGKSHCAHSCSPCVCARCRCSHRRGHRDFAAPLQSAP